MKTIMPEATCTCIHQNGESFNTKTAVKLKTRIMDMGPSYPGYNIQTLYRKSNGAYFVHVQPMVKAGRGRDTGGNPIHYCTMADEPCTDYINVIGSEELMKNWLQPAKG